MFFQTVKAADIFDCLNAEAYAPEHIQCAHTLKQSGIAINLLGNLVAKRINNSIRSISGELNFPGSSVPMFRPADINGGIADPDSAPKLTKAFEAKHEKSRVYPGDVILGIAGTIGCVGRVPEGVAHGNINGSSARILALHDAHAQALSVLPAVDISGMQADRNWIAGRLLALPGSEADRDYVLMGAGENATDDGAMDWVLANPWALLMAMVAYAQDTWAAEARGGLLLELPAGQNAYQPGEVTVLVQGPEGDETRCGTLAELLLRALNHLGMHSFPRQPAINALNTMITPLVGQLLQRRVWRYLDGASGSYGQYQIHPEFADDCYRISGSKVFNRTGRHLWQTVRIQAEQWRSELLPARLLRGD